MKIDDFDESIQHDNSWVDVYDDVLMVELGMRCPLHIPKDLDVWIKTPNERRLLKGLRRRNYGDMRFHSIPSKKIPVRARLTIYLKKNKIFPNTTYSVECQMHEIGDILSAYSQKDKKTGLQKSLVSKYVYNGKTYKPEERPFWYQ